MSIKEIVKAKNMDLLVHSYNREATRVNKEGFINKDSKEIKNLKNRYEALIARFDTDKNTNKKNKEYNYKIRLDSQQINGIKGVKPTLRIRSET